MTGLEALEIRVANDLAALGLGAPTWVTPRAGAYDVVIVGGGQSGLGAAFGLMRERVTNILIIDENPAGKEGPWDTYARMLTLRTPKDLTSIDLGVPSLTFRSWWTAQHGEDGWEALGKIPRETWMTYLRWYRKILSLPVQNGVRLVDVGPLEDGLHHLTVEDADGTRIIAARKVVLATGIQGGGQWHTPPEIKAALPRHRYAHTSEAIDYAAMAGKRIAILGGGASAFDNAQFALSLGVAEAHVFIRRKELPRVNPIRFMERSGVVPRFAALTDDMKYAVMADFFARNQPPTNDTFERAAAYSGFALHVGAPWETVRETADGVEVQTPQGTWTFDFVVLSTGLITDPNLRPELSALAPKIACWRDVALDGINERSPVIDDHPYLGPSFEFQAKRPQDAEDLHGLFAFNYSALISFGLSASALTGLRYAIPRLADGIANQLFNDDKAAWMDAYLRYDELEFVGQWNPALEAIAS